MSYPFDALIVRNSLPEGYATTVNIMLPDLGKIEDRPESCWLPDGAYQLFITPPEDSDRHLALGEFMNTWSGLERAVQMLLKSMLGTNSENMPALSNSLGFRGQQDVILNLGLTQLQDTVFGELNALFERVKVQNTRRNYIVHGSWYCEVIILDKGGTPGVNYKQFRVYNPTSTKPKVEGENPSKQWRDKYYFSTTRIRAIANEVTKLQGDLFAFHSAYYGE